MHSRRIFIFTSCFYILTFLFISGCDKFKTEQEASTDQFEKTVAEKSTLDKLQGKWESLDDSKNVVEFVGNVKTEYYDGEVITISNFEILDKCKSGFSTSDVEGEFIDDNELCYKIEEITDQTLTLIYMDRGNMLRYKRV